MSMDNQQLLQSLNKLTVAIERMYKLQDLTHRKHFYWTRFWGGAFMGLGFTFGTTIFTGIIIWLGTQINIIPYVGQFVKDIIEFVELNS